MDKDKVLSVPLWLLEKNYERKDSYFYYLRILEVLKINFDLEGYWKTGDKVAIVDVDGCRGVIPEGEFSSSGSLTLGEVTCWTSFLFNTKMDKLIRLQYSQLRSTKTK